MKHRVCFASTSLLTRITSYSQVLFTTTARTTTTTTSTTTTTVVAAAVKNISNNKRKQTLVTAESLTVKYQR